MQSNARSSGQAHISKWTRLGFAEGFTAGTATETLVALWSLTESLAFSLAIVARHFGLAFFGP
jgi:hypothetical protein